MRLGINLVPEGCAETAREAERLGYGVAAAPEGFRCDAVSVLSWVAAQTSRIELLSTVIQISARTPVNLALTAATLDGLSGGRFLLGLGISNAHVTEGWHGVPFAKPLARTREYVGIVRRTLAGEPAVHSGEHFTLPLPGGKGGPFQLRGASGAARVPVYLAAVGDRNLELAGEIADGWVGVFCSPEQAGEAIGLLREGRRRAGGTDPGQNLDGFDAFVSVPAAAGDDIAAAAEPISHYVAHFMSLGERGSNFYFRLATRMGYGREAEEVYDRFHGGDPIGAAKAVPLSFIDRTSLLGPERRMSRRIAEYAEAGVTTLGISPYASGGGDRVATMRAVAEAHRSAGAGDPRGPVRRG
ncbi:LLM class flavin-dependent oxidoreductase [Streptomyces scopuliridis]|uniref:LLM class flavin-dependent oxidoreductase n=1 Tax=Streptomyces scopuliridis TaxID=452529 RepID=UPI00368DA7FA